MRLDRRVNYPLFDKNNTSDTGVLTDFIADIAIVPVRIGGVIKSRNAGYLNGKMIGLPLNRAASILRSPYLYKIAAGRASNGGTSRFFGSRR